MLGYWATHCINRVLRSEQSERDEEDVCDGLFGCGNIIKRPNWAVEQDDLDSVISVGNHPDAKNPDKEVLNLPSHFGPRKKVWVKGLML